LGIGIPTQSEQPIYIGYKKPIKFQNAKNTSPTPALEVGGQPTCPGSVQIESTSFRIQTQHIGAAARQRPLTDSAYQAPEIWIRDHEGWTTRFNICSILTQAVPKHNWTITNPGPTPQQRPRTMSAYSAPLSPVDETEEPRFPSSVLPGSADTLQTLVSVSHPRRGSKCKEAAIDSATEQKLWIQCTLNGVKHRGEDWIQPIFTDDEPSGCSACLPDIVVVNGAVNKFSDALASKAPAPWQRILTKAEADACITNYSSRAPPEAACTMPFCDATSTPDTYLYNDKRLFFC
jgi:hypothetical protein